MVERIEVTTGGGSAVYGADAVAGWSTSSCAMVRSTASI
jgi:hypothetical protein